MQYPFSQAITSTASTADSYFSGTHSGSYGGNQLWFPPGDPGTGSSGWIITPGTYGPLRVELPEEWDDLLNELEELNELAPLGVEMMEEQDEPEYEFPHYGYRDDRWEDRRLD